MDEDGVNGVGKDVDDDDGISAGVGHDGVDDVENDDGVDNVGGGHVDDNGDVVSPHVDVDTGDVGGVGGRSWC